MQSIFISVGLEWMNPLILNQGKTYIFENKLKIFSIIKTNKFKNKMYKLIMTINKYWKSKDGSLMI